MSFITIPNDFVIENGVTPGVGHGAIDGDDPFTFTNRQRITGTITIKGSTGNGGHLVGNHGDRYGSLVLLGGISSSVPVVQAGGNIEYHGGGDFPELRVTGTAHVFSGGIPASATVTLGADEMGDGMLSIREPLTLGGLNLGRTGSSDRGVVRGLLHLTGDLTAQGTVTHRIEFGTLDLGNHHSVFTVADGLSDIDLEIASPITGTAGLTKAGAGTLQLLGGITTTGPVMIESGVLAGNATISGALMLSSGVTLAPGTAITRGAISAKSITFGANTTVNLNIGAGGDNLAALDSDGLHVDGTTTLNITTFGGPLGIGVHKLIDYSGTIQGAGLSGFVATLPGRTVGTIIDTGAAVALNVTSNDTTVWTSAVNGIWDAQNTENWKLQSSGATTPYLEGDDVRFDDSAPVASITLNESVRPARVVFANSTNVPYVLAGTGGIEGTAILSKTGSGTATIRNRNGYTGVTTVNEGTLVVDQDTGALTGSSVIEIAPGATLALTSSNSEFTFNRPLSGTGTVVLDANAGGASGNRIIQLTGDNTNFSGNLILSPTPGAGSMRIGFVSPSNLGTATVVIGPGAQVAFDGGQFANPFQITGAGFAYPAGFTPNPGTGLGTEGGTGALFGGGQTLTGPILLNGNAKISSSLSGGGLIVAGSISATAPTDQLVVGGGAVSSIVILTGANSYGPTWVNSGSSTAYTEHTLQIGNDGNTGTLGTGPVTLLGDGSALTTIRFRRIDGYVLENDISAIGSAAKTFVEADVRGAGFSSNGRPIYLGPPDPTGGTFRVGRTRSDSLAGISGVLNAGRISVGSADDITNAALDLEAGSLISIGDFDVGDAAGATGAVTQRDGDVSVAGSMRVGVAYQSTGRYELAGGLLKLTAPAGVSGPVAGSEPGGIRVGGLSGTGGFVQTGGVLTTNWIQLSPGPVPPIGPNPPTGINSYTVIGGVLILNSKFGLTSVEGSTAFNLGGGTIKAAPGVSPVFNSETISVTGLVTLEANGNNAFYLYGPLHGNGEVALTGDGTLHLRDTNGSGGSLRGVSLNVDASAKVRADRTGVEIWSGGLRGSGTLLKENSGSLFLTGTGNGFSGSAVVSAGRLDLPSDFASSSVIVADGAALGGEPTLPTLTMGSASGSSLFVDGSTASALTATNLTLSGTTVVDFSVPPESAAPITVLNYTAKSGTGDVVLAGAADYRSASITDTGSSYVLEVATQNLHWTGLENSGWNLKGFANFYDGAHLVPFYAGDSVTFDDTGRNPDIRLEGGGINPWRVVVDSDTVAYSFSNNSIGGPATLIKAGASTLTLKNANSYSGPTVITGGTISIGLADALGDGSPTNELIVNGGHLHVASFVTGLELRRNVSIGAAGGELSVDPSGLLTISGALSGNGNLRITGGGLVELNGDGSNFTGDITVESPGQAFTYGGLRLGNDQALTSGTVTVLPTAISTSKTGLELEFANIGSAVALKLVTNDIVGTRLASSGGASTWNGPISLSGDGAAELGGAGALYVRGSITVDAGGFDGVLNLGGNGFIGGRVTLPNVPIEIDGGWMVASTGNVWGETRLDRGRLTLGADEALPYLTRITSKYPEITPTFDLNGFSQTIGDLKTDSIRIINAAAALSTLTIQSDSLITYGEGSNLFDTLISGNLRIVKEGSGTLVLDGRNAYSGGTVVNAGTLLVNGRVEGSAVVVNGGTLGGSDGRVEQVNVNSGALAPGASIGTLNTGDVALAAGSVFRLEIDSTAQTTDLLASNGEVTLGLATLDATDLGTGTLSLGERFTFITAISVTGTFDGLPDGALIEIGASQFAIDYTPTSVELVAVIPEPGVFASLLGGCGLLMGLRRFRRR